MLRHIPFFASLLGRELGGTTATNSHVLVYGAIEAHSTGTRGCIASNKTIALETGLGVSTVSKTISQISAAGWVNVVLDKNNHRKKIVPMLEISAPVNPLLTSKPPLTVQKTPPYSPVNIEYSNKNTVRDIFTNVNKVNANAHTSQKTLFYELVGLLGFADTTKWTEQRRRKLNSRLKTFSEDDLRNAARAIADNAFLQGDNDSGKRYGTIDYLLRSDEQVDRWRAEHKPNQNIDLTKVEIPD